jgi:hypothetical protein
MHTVFEVLAVVAIVGYVIGRQLRGEALRGKRLIVLPVVLTAIGASDLGKHSHRDLRSADVVCIAISAVIAAVIGLAQGSKMRLETRDGALWGQMQMASLWLWLGLLVSRAVMTGVASGLHAHVAASTTPILLILGVNRLAQAVVIAARALTMGTPFAPEKDGKAFLANVFGAVQGPVGTTVGGAVGARAGRSRRHGR